MSIPWIEYDGSRPAYVGSDRYEELAATIAENAPRVDDSEELQERVEELLDQS